MSSFLGLHMAIWLSRADWHLFRREVLSDIHSAAKAMTAGALLCRIVSILIN